MTYSDYEIEGVREGRGQQMVKCPKCSWDRKKKNLKTLSVNTDKRVWNCHHCGWKGGLFDMDIKTEQKVYIKPSYTQTELSEQTVKYFLARGISTFVINRNKITESVESLMQKESGTFKPRKCINFNCFRDGELINTQFRDRDKNFKLVKDAELIPYGLDDIKGKTEFLICEGQFDKLAWEEAGFVNCISVPNGATLQSNNLKWVDNSWQYFQKATRIYLATDGDPAGIALRDELAYRLGLEKCFTVSYPKGCKDANEVLLNASFGKAHLKAMITNAKPWPIQGVADNEELCTRWIQKYYFGNPYGCKTGMGYLDQLITFKEGHLSIWTGKPNGGKSDIIDEICLRLAILHDWKFGVFSPENWPVEDHLTKLIEKYIGFSLLPKRNIDADLLTKALHFISSHFFFIEDQEDREVDLSVLGLLDMEKELKLRFGINAFVIDPWNVVEHNIPGGTTETQYISKSLSQIARAGKRNNVHTFIVAHPFKLKKDGDGKYPVASLYDISGSANWYNKADIGVSVYREENPDKIDKSKGDNVQIHIQKMRFKWIGRNGHANFQYDLNSGLYSPIGREPSPLMEINSANFVYRDIPESQEPRF